MNKEALSHKMSQYDLPESDSDGLSSMPAAYYTRPTLFLQSMSMCNQVSCNLQSRTEMLETCQGKLTFSTTLIVRKHAFTAKLFVSS